MILHVDYETYSEIDIDNGTHNYLRHPSAELLLIQFAIDDGPTHYIDMTVIHHQLDSVSGASGAEQELDRVEYFKDLLRQPGVEVHAFNAYFERWATHYLLGITLPASVFRCTMVHAYYLGFAGSLDKVGAQMGLAAEDLKHHGKDLIRLFCSPIKRKGGAVTRTYPWDRPEEWQKFIEYGVQDVHTERKISQLLASYPVPEFVWANWFVDQKINDRGLPVDIDLINAAVRLSEVTKEAAVEELTTITGLKNASSPTQVSGWLATHGLRLPNMQKATILRAMKRPGLADEVLRVLQLHRENVRTSLAKYSRAQENAFPADGWYWLRGIYQFLGAQRTGRFAGRLIQGQNMPRPEFKRPERVAHLIKLMNPGLLEMFAPARSFLVSSIRCMVTPPPGYRLAVCDLKSIESRVLGWISNCDRMNRLFAQNLDTYKDFASELFGIPYDQVTKDQRDYSKPPTLGCGFGLGPGGPEVVTVREDGQEDTKKAYGLIAYAAGMGVDMPRAEAVKAVVTFRSMYKEVPEMWEWLTQASIATCKDYLPREGYRIRFRRDDNFLMLDLPSGRTLHYYHPNVKEKHFRVEVTIDDEGNEVRDTVPVSFKEYEAWEGDKYSQPCLTYYGQVKGVWKEQQTWGGKITENICQAIAYDILMQDVCWLEESGATDYGAQEFQVVGHSHDEVIAMVPKEGAEELAKRMEHVMSTSMPWCQDLILGAEGGIMDRYGKL